MKMKKIFVLGLTVLILSFGFISCSDGSDDGGGGVTVPSEYRGTWNHTDGHKVVIGEKSVTLTRSGESPITLQYVDIDVDPSAVPEVRLYFVGTNNRQIMTDFDSPNNRNLLNVIYMENNDLIFFTPSGTWTKQQ